MSGAFDVEGARRAGYTEAEIVNFLASRARFDAEAARSAGYSEPEILVFLTRPLPRTAGENFGLGARSVARGLTGIPGLAYDAIGAGINALNDATGGYLPRVNTARSNVDAVADAAGAPRPRNREERTTGRLIEEVAALGPTAAAGLAMRGAQGVTGAVGRALTGAPTAQVAGAAGSALAGQAAQEAGYGPVLEAGASLLGGAAGATAAGALQTVPRLAAAAIEPFSGAGRERIAADVLLRSSARPGTLVGRMAEGVEDTSRRLPGSPVTAAQASRDPGVAVLERGVMSGDPQANAVGRDMMAARNNARLEAFGTLRDGALPEARGAAVRDTLRANERAALDLTSQVYQAVDPNNAARFDLSGVANAANAQLGRYGGLRGEAPAELRAVVDDIAAAVARGPQGWREVQDLRSRLGEIGGQARAAGQRVLAADVARISSALDAAEEAALRSGSFQPWQRDLWELGRNLRRATGETFGRNAEGVATVGQILRADRFGNPIVADAEVARRAIATPQALAQVMAAAGGARPAVRQALQQQFLDDWLAAARTASSVTDSSGRMADGLSTAQALRFWQNNEAVGSQLFGSRAPLVQRLIADFEEEAAVTRASAARGSDTAQNLSVGNMIARASGGLLEPNSPALQAMVGMGPVMRLIYAAPEAATRELIAQAVTDARFAAMLLARATPENVRRASEYVNRNMADRIGDAVFEAGVRATARAVNAEALQGQQQPQ